MCAGIADLLFTRAHSNLWHGSAADPRHADRRRQAL